MWFRHWNEPGQRLRGTLLSALVGFVLFLAVRIPAGYGNILPFDTVGSVSFFFIQKYPPSLAHNFLFPALIMALAGLFMVVGPRLGRLFHPIETYGRTPFFFYMVHIPLLALLTRRTGLLPWKEGEVGTALLAWVGLLIVMYPLCRWFGGVKARTRNPLIRMM
jgi:peptidoglycan/LPS O-acetylase OafA/YrhL